MVALSGRDASAALAACADHARWRAALDVATGGPAGSRASTPLLAAPGARCVALCGRVVLCGLPDRGLLQVVVRVGVADQGRTRVGDTAATDAVGLQVGPAGVLVLEGSAGGVLGVALCGRVWGCGVPAALRADGGRPEGGRPGSPGAGDPLGCVRLQGTDACCSPCSSWTLGSRAAGTQVVAPAADDGPALADQGRGGARVVDCVQGAGARWADAGRARCGLAALPPAACVEPLRAPPGGDMERLLPALLQR